MKIITTPTYISVCMFCWLTAIHNYIYLHFYIGTHVAAVSGIMVAFAIIMDIDGKRDH